MRFSSFGRARSAIALAAPPAYRLVARVHAQSGPRNTATPQKLDEDYTARIKKATPDAAHPRPSWSTTCRRRRPCRRRSSSSATCPASPGN